MKKTFSSLLGLELLLLALTISGVTLGRGGISSQVFLSRSVWVGDSQARTVTGEIGLRNISRNPLIGRIRAVVEEISRDDVAVVNPDGYTPEGHPYFLYETGEDGLTFLQSTEKRPWIFSNPQMRFFQATVNVYEDNAPEPPVVTFSASAAEIVEGESVTLTWSSQNAQTCVIAPEIGQVDISGSLEVTLSETATYTITATGDGGEASAAVSVTVVPRPQVNLNVDPESIYESQSAALSWTSTDADSVVIDPGVGEVAASGQMTVTPAATTTYTITAAGPGGTVSDNVTVTVNPMPAPQVQIGVDPLAILQGESVSLFWNTSYAQTVEITPEIGTVAASGEITITPDYTTTYTITASGPGGTRSASATVKVNPNLPYQPVVELSAAPQVIAKGSSTVLSWTSSNAVQLFMDQGIGMLEASGSLTLSPEATTTYTLTATGTQGNVSECVTVQVTAEPEAPAEGSFGENYTDLIPEDATLEGYDEERFAVITGQVMDEHGDPLPDVRITIKDHPQYGSVVTDADGVFSLPVEGGSILTVVYEKEGLLTSHRKLETVWNDIAIAETVTLLKEDVRFSVMSFDGNPDTVMTHRSATVADKDGSRALTMVLSGDNRAWAVDENGNDMFELTTIVTRATEYRTPESMPAILPPATAFTYCAELKVDGVERVRFKEPVVSYVDNFLGFDVGEVVPAGYYDRDAGEWIASDNGIVVKFLDTDNDGVVDALDIDGDDVEDDLDADGMFDDEVVGLNDPARYVPGTTYWRVELDHFTSWDYNWAYGPPLDAIEPNATAIASVDQQEKNPCEQEFGSFVTARSRVYHEDIPIPGTDLTLHYSSSRVHDYRHVITVPASGASVPASLKEIVVKLQVAGKTFQQILPPLPDQTATFVWDGSNYLGNRIDLANAHISIGFIYDGVYVGIRGAGFGSSPVFGIPGTNLTGILSRRGLLLDKTYDILIHNKAKNGIYLTEGWDLSNHHGVNADTLYKGNGRLVPDALKDGVYGAIAYYSFDGSANDESGYGHHGIVSGASLTTDRFGRSDRAYEFDGRDDYLYLGARIRPRLPLTFSVWIYPEVYKGSGIIVLSGRQWYYCGPSMILSNSGGVELQFGDGGYAAGYSRRSKFSYDHLPLRTWTHVVGVIRGPVDMDIYINGKNVSGQYDGSGGEMAYASESGHIGVYTTYQAFFKGKIDEVRVYDRALSQDDVNALMSSASQDITYAEGHTGYVISETGLHETTFDLDTGVTLETFTYDSDDRLISVTDQFGNVLTIERDAAGVPQAIVSPDGIRTELVVDADNHLKEIRYPDGGVYRFDYTAGGLMTRETEPNGNAFVHVFDANGRVIEVSDQEGGSQTFGRQVLANGDIETTLTTAEGVTTTYLDHTDPDGRFTSTITGCSSGACATQYERSADELSVQKTHPDGTVLDFQYDYDPQYKTKYITDMTVTTPAGLTMTAQAARSYTDTDSNGDPDQIQKTVTVNGRTTTSLTDTLASIVSTTSPQGRTATAAYDPVTLLTSRVSVPGLLDTHYGYDSQGRLTSVTTGTRVSVLTYDSNGNLHSMEDPQHQVTTFDYDAVGRQTAVHQPDGTSVSVQYDLNGNMTVVRTPKNANHGFVYNSVNRVTAYDPPLSGDSTYTYDKDRRLIQKTFPSGKQIKNIYNLERLVQIQTPEGNVDLTYLNSNQLDTISKGAESLSYTYDGSLVTSKTSAGTLNQTISYSYNNDLQLSGTTYAGSSQSFGYDNDGLLTAAGGFAITRDTNNGLPLGADDGVMNLARSFNGYGEIASQAVTVNSSSVTDWNLTYNDNGQITARTETVAGTSASYSYEYDTAGRLIKVYKDGVLIEEYGYTDGIRTSETNTLRGITGKVYSYNTEDQLLTAGGVTYQYNADGFLWTKVDGINTTTYNYSSRGELLSVDLASGTSITYDHDPLGRRIAKKVNGTITEKYLWEGMTRLLAVYDSADQLMMRFEYADARVPVRMERGGAVYYLSYDQVGSLRVVTDAAGNVVKRIDYDSFGNIIADTDTSFEVPFGFAGGLHDRDTGLVRFGFRDYDPQVGRWTAKDPIMFLSGQTDVYGYTFSDPINFNDPLGLEADDMCQGYYADDYDSYREEVIKILLENNFNQESENVFSKSVEAGTFTPASGDKSLSIVVQEGTMISVEISKKSALLLKSNKNIKIKFGIFSAKFSNAIAHMNIAMGKAFLSQINMRSKRFANEIIGRDVDIISIGDADSWEKK